MSAGNSEEPEMIRRQRQIFCARRRCTRACQPRRALVAVGLPVQSLETILAAKFWALSSEVT